MDSLKVPNVSLAIQNFTLQMWLDDEGRKKIVETHKDLCEQIESANQACRKLRTELENILKSSKANLTSKKELNTACRKVVDSTYPLVRYPLSGDIWNSIGKKILDVKTFTISYYSEKEIDAAISWRLKQKELEETNALRVSSCLSNAKKLLIEKNMIEEVTTLSDKDVVSVAEQILFEEALDKEVGEVEIDFCDYCSVWIPDNHRCSCGNRRVCWEKGGCFLDGTGYLYPAGY